MADALIIKSGGDFQLRGGGASLAVKDSGAPPYIVDGLIQSHWLVESAAVSGGDVVSIPDQSNVASLSSTFASTNKRWSYSASGWSLNGKTLPTMTAKGTSGGMNANLWATLLNGYAGAWTVCGLYDFQGIGPVATTFGAFSWGDYHRGCERNGSNSYADIRRRVETGGIEEITVRGAVSSGKHLIFEEYAGTSAPTDISQFRRWIDGNSVSLSVNSGSGGKKPLSGLIEFSVGARYSGHESEAGFKIAQFHIWKGALTDAQRNSVTAYLKSISGIA